MQTLNHARSAADAGADIIVAQGTEAGGHAGARTTLTLVPAVADAVAPLPVVAAGGITDGRGLAAALALGASGVLMGTRFFATTEALGHENAKARLVSAGGDETLQTTVFDIVRELTWPDAYPLRTVRNAFSERWHGSEAVLRSDVASGDKSPIPGFKEAFKAGDTEEIMVAAGQGLDLVNAIEPAGDVVARIVADAELALAQAHGQSHA